MAEPAIGVLDTCPQVDTCSSKQETPHANGQPFDQPVKNNQETREKNSCEDPKVTNDNPSVFMLAEPSSQKVSDPPPTKIIPEMSQEVEVVVDGTCENIMVPCDGNLQYDLSRTVPDSEETTNSKSIEAISLVDIKASILDDHEMVSGDVNDCKAGADSTLSVCEAQSSSENNRLQNLIDTEISSSSECDPAFVKNEQQSEEPIEDIQVSNQQTSEEPIGDIQVSNQQTSEEPIGDIQVSSQQTSEEPIEDIQVSNQQTSEEPIEDIQVSNQQTSDEPIEDIQISKSKTDLDNGKTIVSKYAIQPGQLTNQLIEGPSITLPPSQVSNRLRLSSNSSCDPTSSGKEHSNGISATTSQLDRNGNSGVPKSSETNSAKENAPAIAPAMQATTSTTTTTLPPTSMSVSAGNGSGPTTSESVTRDSNSTPKISPATPSVVPAKKVKKTPHDFIFGKVLGEGSYSTVYLAKEVSSQREFAVKVCEKKHLIREHKTHFVMREKEVLMRLDHPFFIKLAYTFQDPERLYYVLTYARNGELLSYLNKLSAFDVPCTRFYSAEVVVALEYLQSLGIIHRDLKPENILLGDDMHIKITDFGTSKIVTGTGATEEKPVDENKGRHSKRKNSFVGTAEYVSPEVLNGVPANYGTDLWALGCILFQCLSSSLPFRSGNEYQTFQKILKLEYDFPEGFNEEAKDLVQKLLVIESSERLGMDPVRGMQDIKQHAFFLGIDWDNLPTSTPPKLLPYLPATASNPEFWGGQEQRTGFDDQRLAEIITGQSERSQSPELEPVSLRGKNGLEECEWREKIEKQRHENQFHQFVENNLILRQGFVDKRKGLFARKRMLLLTEGPHLYYVDAHNKVLKGEIPWSKELRSEAKNFKIFFVHTPNRTYYLESRNPDAHHWVKRIQEVWDRYYAKDTDS